jgi:hypothetical protein
MANSEKQKRMYQTFDPAAGYPAGEGFFYECVKCGDSISSAPKDSMGCKCKNIFIDVDYGRISIKDHKAAKLFTLA